MTPDHMTCQEFVELVTEYLEGSLDGTATRRFDEHMALCDGCATYLEQMREAARMVGRLDESHLSEPARGRLLDAFRDWKAVSG